MGNLFVMVFAIAPEKFVMVPAPGHPTSSGVLANILGKARLCPQQILHPITFSQSMGKNLYKMKIDEPGQLFPIIIQN